MSKKIFIFLLLSILFNPEGGYSECLRDFCLKASDGTPVCAKQFAGRPFLVDFWAAWCPKCRSAFQWHQSKKRNEAHAGLQTVFINLDHDRDDALDFLKEIGSSAIVLFDAEGTTAEQCALDSIPAAVLFDSSGAEVKRWYGFNSAIQEELSLLYTQGDMSEKK